MGSTMQQRGHIAFTEQELLLGLKMMEKLEKVTDMMLYFLDKEQIKFTYILMCSDDENFESFVRKEKRDTDLLIPIDIEQSLYVVVCQETNIKGGYHFAERIIRLLNIEEHSECSYCNATTVSSARHSTKAIIFYLLDAYLKLSKMEPSERRTQIDFRTLS